MHDPDATHGHRSGIATKLAIAALSGATVAVMTLPAANADPTTPPPPPPPSGNTFLNGPPPGDPNAAPAPPPAAAPAAPPPAGDPNAPPADPNAAPTPPPAPSEPGRINNAAGGFSYVVPAGWKVADATQLSYGQALLNKIPTDTTPPNGQPAQPNAQPAQPPSDTSVLLGRLDLKLFAGAETDNTKAAQRLASDMGEFFMPFPGTRINQEAVPLNAGGMTGVASYYEVKFTDTSKPDGQIWAGVVGAPTQPGAPRGQRAPDRWFVVWLGTTNNPVPKPDAVTLAQSIRPFTPPPPPPPDPNAPPPPAGGTNVPGQRPEVGVPMPVTNAPPEMQPPQS